MEAVSEETNILKNLNINIKKGAMVAFVGDVGSGKSSFLFSLIGEMKFQSRSNPRLKLHGSVSLVNQKPWILNATLKDNILFGLEFDEQKYQESIQYACLEADLLILQKGDQTMIGEKGINLSGGQKARVALARALYSDSDILLLDDILSAVDIHVGIQIVKQCLMRYRKDKTRVLVTHALQYMKYMDYIYFMENGEILNEGTYEEIQRSEKFKQIYKKFTGESDLELLKDDSELLNDQKLKQDKFSHINLDSTNFKKGTEENKLVVENQLTQRPVTLNLETSKQTQDEQLNKKHEKPKTKDKYDELILEEDRKKGKVEWQIFKSFFQLLGGFVFIVTFLIAISGQTYLRIYSNIWMTIWTEDKDDSKNLSYLQIYSLLTFGYVLCVALRSSINFISSFKTARQVHQAMTASLMYAPLNEFFERIPLGRILNRLTKDLQSVDLEMSMAFAMLSSVIFNLITNCVICIYSSTIFVIFPIVMFIGFSLILLQFFQKAQREVVRLESITKSPVISFFSESLNGLPSIRAYDQQKRFLDTQCLHTDENRKNQISLTAMQQWFRITLSMFALIINATSLAYCLFTEQSNPSLTGLLLTFAFQIDFNVRFMLISYANFENKLVSFERCTTYMNIECEPGYRNYFQNRKQFKKAGILTHQSIQLENWPSDGVIEFRNVYVRYRSNLDPVLKGLNFIVSPQEKVGIVGRTGAGKSTITLCILRVLELLEGQILVDGLNIAKLTLQEIRSKITIILQDPSLYEGTLRENVDPLNLHSDQQIIETLYKCNLKNLLETRKGLETKIDDQGENLSVGEKQLICIARALLKKSKLILIDEATANIDIETEQLIQKTIKDVFKECTVLTIAHRINTIMGSDRILVMNQGRAEEFDTPKNLLKNQESLFYKLHTAAQKEGNI